MKPVSSVLMTMENGKAGGCADILFSSARIRVGLCIMESGAQLAAWYSVHHTPLVPHNTLHPGTSGGQTTSFWESFFNALPMIVLMGLDENHQDSLMCLHSIF